jgi:uncharacterized repeat protein (TIGR01451 family)
MFRAVYCAALIAAFVSVASAATFDVTDPTEFQTALTTAQANGESDTINVAGGVYNVMANGTLTYTAVASENFGLIVNGADSTLVTLDGGSQVPILRIDTTAVTLDDGIMIDVNDMTFRNGNAVGTPNDGGALAIVLDESNQPATFAISVVVSGSEFYDNAADDDGGAVYIRGIVIEGLVLFDLTFDGNQASGDGGAAYVAGWVFNTPVSVVDIDFFNNMAQGNGGALVVEGFDAATPSEDRVNRVDLLDITFFNNRSMSLSGGGGGADISALTTTVDLVGFIDNSAGNEGGGLRIRQNFGTLVVVNSGFVGNTADDEGGGLAAAESIFADVTLTNNTFTENSATSIGGGAFIAFDGGTGIAKIYNNIIWGNLPQGVGEDLYVENNALGDIPGIVEIFNNDIGDLVVAPGPVSEGNNIDANPMFVDMTLRPLPDLRLMAGSPAIDTGDDNAPWAPLFDFEGDPRPFDGNGDMTATIDIGIDEFTGAVVQDADLAVTLSDDPDPVTFGGNITYTATVTNNGPGVATSVQFDGFHADTAFVSATPSQGPACAAGFGLVQCQLGTIANGATAVVTTVLATVNPVMVPTPVSFGADVTANENDPNMTDNNAVEQTTVVPPGPAMADLAITKVDTPDPVFSGGPQLTYDITVTNNGPDGATGVTMTDTLPAGVVYNAATSTLGSCAEGAGVVTCNIGDLALDATATVTITVAPDEVAAPTDITNDASVTAAEIDPVAGNNSVAEITTVNPPSSDMMIAMSVSPASPLINEQVSFDFTVSNDGPSDNTNVLLTLTLPVNGTAQSITVDQGSCGTPNGTVDCTIGDMPFGATVSGRVVVTAPGQPATLTLSATVSGDVADPTPANNSASDAVSVIDVVDLIIQGQSKGTGSLGWAELLLMLTVASFIGLRATLHRTPIRSVAALFALVGAVSLLVCMPTDDARAEGEWYVGTSIGASDADYSTGELQSDLANLGWSINNASVDDTDTAWKAYAGFAFNEYIAVEGGFVDLGEVETEFGATVAPTQIDAILSDTYSIHPVLGDGWFGSVVLSWPVSPDRFSLTARAGLFGWESDIDVRVISGGTGSVSDRDSGTDMLYGVGIEWRLNEQWSLMADWERYELKDWVDAPSIGVKIRF